MSGALAWAAASAMAGLGAVGRILLDEEVSARSGGPFPLGILVVNLSGAFALGVLHGAGLGGHALLILGTGLLGGFTTFSTWMLESERLFRDGAVPAAWLNLGFSLLAGLLAAVAGDALGGAL